jgi:hypothetical protein
MKYTLEELRTAPVARDFVAMFRNWLVRTGRVNRSISPESAGENAG